MPFRRLRIVEMVLGLAGLCCISVPVFGLQVGPGSGIVQKGTSPAHRTFALVIGISHYQDPDLPDMVLPHRDAELFAGYLQLQPAFTRYDQQVLLLTNSDATTARVAVSLDWIMDAAEAGDTVILFYSGYGVVPSGRHAQLSRPFFYDTPWSLNQAGTFDLFQLFRTQARAKKLEFLLVGHVCPVVLSEDILEMKLDINASYRSEFDRSIVLNTVTEATFHQTPGTMAKYRVSLSNLIVDGLLGLADRNGDQYVSLKELNRFIKRQPIRETRPGMVILSAPHPWSRLSTVSERFRDQLKKAEQPTYPSLVQMETTTKVERVLEQLGEGERLLYQDFIMAIKLGHLILPADQNANAYYEQLIRIPELKPLYGDIRRKLAAAFQDETQQALNAYLSADSRELARRRDGLYQYSLYPFYMQRTIDLLGEGHYMSSILMAKKYYFEGLNKRFEADHLQDSSLLHDGLYLQELALAFEAEAPFIYNEIGVIYSQQGRTVDAEEAFRKAIELSPAWSIPYANLGLLYINSDPRLAHRLGRHAARLSPNSSYARNGMGMASMQMGDLEAARSSFMRAVELDPGYIDAWYNLGCLASLEGQYGEAYAFLDKAFQLGFSDIEHAHMDDDLAAFRKQRAWQDLVRQYFGE